MSDAKPWMAATVVLTLVVFGLVIFMVTDEPCPQTTETTGDQATETGQAESGDQAGKVAGKQTGQPDDLEKSPGDKPSEEKPHEVVWYDSQSGRVDWPTAKSMPAAEPAEAAKSWTEIRKMLGHKPVAAVLMSRPIPPYKMALDSFRKHFDGNLEIFDLQTAKNQLEVLSQIQKRSPDLYLAIGSKALKLLKENIKDKPVVFVMVLVPGKLPANVAGVTMHLPAREHLKALKLISPGVRSLMFPVNPMRSKARADEFVEAGKMEGVTIQLVSGSTKKELFNRIRKAAEQADALYMTMDQDVVASFNLLHSLSMQQKKPLVTFSYKYVEMGATLAACPKFGAMGAQAAELARRILKGESPSEYPTVHPDEYYYSYNTNSGIQLGIGIPQAIIQSDHKLYR